MAKTERKQAQSFGMIAYPESCDIENLIEAIGDFASVHYMERRRNKKHYQGYYILHDMDIWTEEDEKENAEHKAGEYKKPHYHIIVKYDWEASTSKLRKYLTKLAGIVQLEVITYNPMKKYLIHAEDTDKTQYESNKVKEFGCAEPYAIKQLQHESQNYRSELELAYNINQIIQECHCNSAWEVQMVIYQMGDIELMKYFKSNKLLIENHIRGMRYNRDKVTPHHYQLPRNEIREMTQYELEKALYELEEVEHPTEDQRTYKMLLKREFERRAVNRIEYKEGRNN